MAHSFGRVTEIALGLVNLGAEEEYVGLRQASPTWRRNRINAEQGLAPDLYVHQW